MAAPEPTATAHAAHVAFDGGYTSNMHTLTNENGNAVTLLVCTSCHFIEAQCAHEKNTWFNDAVEECPPPEYRGGVKLLCDLCGQDGT